MRNDPRISFLKRKLSKPGNKHPWKGTVLNLDRMDLEKEEETKTNRKN